jgi:serine/threonine protein kinase
MNNEKWQRVEELFDEAQQLAVDERLPYLNLHCGGDGELRTELERLLAADKRAKARRLFEQAAWGMNPNRLELETLPARETMIDKVVGVYTIKRRLDEGGFGEVYLAVGNVAGREAGQFVIKFAKEQDEDQRRRFLEEVRINAELRHEHIASINHWGEFEGRLYLVIDYIAGSNLGRFIKERGKGHGLDPVMVGEIVRQAGTAIQFAHEKGVIHRDLKPANIMIQESEPRVTVKVIDFGLAKSAAAITRRPTSGIIGSLNYISPEQINPQRYGEPGPSCDIYAMGLVIHEMLTGRIAIDGPSQSTLLYNQLEFTPPPPGISPAVDQVVMRALRKVPAQRQPSMVQLISELDEAIAGLREKPTLPASTRSRREVLIGGAALLILGGAGLGWHFSQAPGEEISPPPAGQPDLPGERPTMAAAKLTVFQLRTKGGAGEIVGERVFTSRDKLRFTVEAPTDGFIYLVQRGTLNDLTLLYPDPQSRNYRENQVSGGTPVFFPPADAQGEPTWFSFNGAPGVETIYAVFTRDKSTRLARLIEDQLVRNKGRRNGLNQLLLDEGVEAILREALTQPGDDSSSVSRIELRHAR